MEQRDLVIGAITNYNWDQIKYWVNSLDRSGFSAAGVNPCGFDPPDLSVVLAGLKSAL